MNLKGALWVIGCSLARIGVSCHKLRSCSRPVLEVREGPVKKGNESSLELPTRHFSHPWNMDNFGETKKSLIFVPLPLNTLAGSGQCGVIGKLMRKSSRCAFFPSH